MKRYMAGVVVLTIALAGSGLAFSQTSPYVEDLSKAAVGAPPMLGIHWTRGFKPDFLAQRAAKGDSGGKGGGGGRKRPPQPSPNPNMLYNNGNIMPTATTAAIFWGTSWSSYSGDEISGMDLWYDGFSDSHYAMTSDEYTGLGALVGPATTYLGHVVDTTAASGGNNTSAIQSEVCKVIPSPDPSGNGYYAVYTDIPRGNANYCAWHSWGSCGGIPMQFAFFWKLDGDPGCDPQSPVATESQGLAALANVSGHELSEARTDPRGTGWFDSSGQENGDKCAWTFGAPYITFSNGSEWKIQGEWSNNAYNASTGYPNTLKQNGCLSGQ